MINIVPLELTPSMLGRASFNITLSVSLMIHTLKFVSLQVKVTLSLGNKTAVFGVNETIK